MNPSLIQGNISPYQQRWQTVLPSQIPNAVYQYNPSKAVTERLVMGTLNDQSLVSVMSELASRGTHNLSVLLGLDPNNPLTTIEEDPAFKIFINVITDGIPSNNFFEVEWVKDPQLPSPTVNSGMNAIPGEEAYIFVVKWLELLFNDLSTQFESIATNLDQRVKQYIFSASETTSIYQALQAKVGNGRMGVFLGSGMTIQAHPYSFRPVIEVNDKGTQPFDFLNGNGSFFDFSKPCPPYCDPS